MLLIFIGVAVVIACGLVLFIMNRKKISKSEAHKQIKADKLSAEDPKLSLNEEGETGLALTEEELGLDSYEDALGNKLPEDDLFDDDFDDEYGDFDESMFDFDEMFDEEEVKRSELVEEIHNMSPKMKALLLTGALDRKYF